MATKKKTGTKKTGTKKAAKEEGAAVSVFTDAPESYDHGHASENTGETAQNGNPVRKVTVKAADQDTAESLARYQAQRYESGLYFALDSFEFEAWKATKNG